MTRSSTRKQDAELALEELQTATKKLSIQSHVGCRLDLPVPPPLDVWGERSV